MTHKKCETCGDPMPESSESQHVRGIKVLGYWCSDLCWQRSTQKAYDDGYAAGKEMAQKITDAWNR